MQGKCTSVVSGLINTISMEVLFTLTDTAGHGQVLRVDRRLMRLKKSDIECVILAGSSRFAISEGEITTDV